jgi:membrane protein YdbS with pleckstrin-like domain
MKNLNDLKAIWLTAKTNSLPDSEEMMLLVKKYRRQKLSKFTALITVALLSVATMIVVVFRYRSTMITTRIGESFIIATALILAATNLNSLNRFYRLTARSNKEFILFLEHTRVRQLFYYKWTQVVAQSFCLAGLLLYLYEAVYKHNSLLIISYTAIILYILIMWVFIRPRLFKKQSQKLNAMIEKLEKLSKQF